MHDIAKHLCINEEPFCILVGDRDTLVSPIGVLKGRRSITPMSSNPNSVLISKKLSCYNSQLRDLLDLWLLHLVVVELVVPLACGVLQINSSIITCWIVVIIWLVSIHSNCRWGKISDIVNRTDSWDPYRQFKRYIVFTFSITSPDSLFLWIIVSTHKFLSPVLFISSHCP